MKNNHCGIIYLSFIAFLLLVSSRAFAAPVRFRHQNAAPQAPMSQAEAPRLPVYIAELSNVNDYRLFANGGWDGNWYAGFNVCWIEELPPPPAGKYRRAFIGAKLGRAKTRPVSGKPVWEKEAIPGEIFLSLASTPSWEATQKYFLTDAGDIPVEGDPENALENAGESRWFWAEVPLDAVNLTGKNYLALWSPTEYFVSIASSPVIAGGWGGQKINSWLNNDVKGYAPLNPATSLKTPISVFEPAIAMKLIPEERGQEIIVTVVDVKGGRDKTGNKTFIASVEGQEIEKAWLEISVNGGSWKKQGRYVYTAPYMFTLKADVLSGGKTAVRCAATDIWGDTGYSRSVELQVTR
jgi:hypothetical protein